MFTFHAWITTRIPVEEGAIIAGLVAKGYDVSVAAADGNLILVPLEKSYYAILAFKLSRELASVTELYEDLIKLLTDNKVSYYSLIVSQFSDASVWNAGNVSSAPSKNNTAKKIIN